MTVIAAPQVVVPGDVLTEAEVAVEDGRITGLQPSAGGRRADVVLPEGVLVPGLIDLQINGCFGVDFVDASAKDWEDVAAKLLATGITSFVPTFITAPVGELAAALVRAGEILHRGRLGGARGLARVLGVHVEGPFLSERRRG
ncbi:MAG: hypothetical protein WCB04_15845, partial [Mycobacteriales bacterium]